MNLNRKEIEEKLEHYTIKSINDKYFHINLLTKDERSFIHKYDIKLYNLLYGRFRTMNTDPKVRHNNYIKYKDKIIKNKYNVDFSPYEKYKEIEQLNKINI